MAAMDGEINTERIADHKILQKILRTEAGLLKVQRWLERYAPEEVSLPQFWYDLQVFRRLKNPDELRIAALEVCAGYLNAGSADRHVTITAGTAHLLIDHAQDAGPAFFERAQQEVFWRLHAMIMRRPDSLTELIAQVTTQSDGEGQLHFNSRTARELDLTKLKARHRLLVKSLAPSKDVGSVRRIASHGTERLRRSQGVSRTSHATEPPHAALNPALLKRKLSTVVVRRDPRSTMLLAHCDVWDYADLCSEDIVGMELGVHTFHRKMSKREEEHPILHECRERAEKLGKLWTPTNSKHEGLKSALIAANEHIAVTPPLLLFGGSHDGPSILFRDGSIVSYVTNQAGRLAQVSLDTSLQGKIRDYGGLSDASFLPKVGLLVRFVGLPGVSRIRLVAGGAAQLEHGVSGGSTPKLERKHQSSMTAIDPTAARRGGFVEVHPSGTTAVTWWPHPIVTMTSTDNVLISHIRSSPGFTSKVVQRFETTTEIVRVFWGLQPTILYILNVEVSSTFDSIVTLRQYTVLAPRTGGTPGDTSPGRATSGPLLTVPGTPTSPTGGAPPRVDHSITAVMAGGTAVYAPCPVSDRMLVVGQHGSLLLIDIKAQDTLHGRGKFELPTTASWHPAGVVVAIAAANRIHLFDSMLAPLRSSWVGEEPSPHSALRLPIDSPNVYTLLWTNIGERGGRPSESATNFLVVGAAECPLIVVEFLMKGPAAHFMRYRWAVKGRLAAGQGKEAVRLLSRLDWRSDIASSFRLLTDVVNHFVSLPFSQENNECIRDAFPPFSWHISDIQHQQYTMWDSRIQALQRRYFQFLLAEKKLTLALYFAAELRSREMLDSLLTFAEKQEGDVAQFVAIVSRAAYALTASVTVGFV